jgi:hypothetical protein
MHFPLVMTLQRESKVLIPSHSQLHWGLAPHLLLRVGAPRDNRPGVQRFKLLLCPGGGGQAGGLSFPAVWRHDSCPLPLTGSQSHPAVTGLSLSPEATGTTVSLLLLAAWRQAVGPG